MFCLLVDCMLSVLSICHDGWALPSAIFRSTPSAAVGLLLWRVLARETTTGHTGACDLARASPCGECCGAAGMATTGEVILGFFLSARGGRVLGGPFRLVRTVSAGDIIPSGFGLAC